jgi:hypothetical protein
VDFDFEYKRELIRVKRGPLEQGDLSGLEQAKQLHIPGYEEVWTGDYVFENEWQSSAPRRTAPWN